MSCPMVTRFHHTDPVCRLCRQHHKKLASPSSDRYANDLLCGRSDELQDLSHSDRRGQTLVL